MFKSGFVNILGNPNVGKSTLMNALVGEKLSIITPKVQTTRHRILGIVNGEGFQAVFSDTPGILKPKYLLQEKMMESVSTAITDADVIVYVTDVSELPDKKNEYLDRIEKTGIPVIVVINKIDLSNQEQLEALVGKWKEIFGNAVIIPVSALLAFNIKGLLDIIIERLPEGEPYFPPDQLTDRYERFFASEIIREKILLNYEKEVPYSVEVEIESFLEEEKINRIRAVIYIERDSQKGIIIGHRGSMLKKTGTDARMEMEKFFGKKIFLELYVKVKKEWRGKPDVLKKFGYR
ncbi:MAG TPA: GTPase Era [Bacteroidales bacterium]|nr:GTPase Era [Bacteroidales bacterium]